MIPKNPVGYLVRRSDLSIPRVEADKCFGQYRPLGPGLPGGLFARPCKVPVYGVVSRNGVVVAWEVPFGRISFQAGDYLTTR